MENQSQFYQLLSEYMEDVAARKKSQDDLNGAFNELMYMIERDQVSPPIVVDSVSRIFSQYPSFRLFLLFLMQGIVATSAMNGGYDYPEFFWIVVKFNLFFESDHLSDLMNHLSNFCDRQVLRSYLTYALMTAEKEKQKDIVHAFYYVGYTVDSLKIVADMIPMNADNLELYDYIFGCVISFVFSGKVTSSSDEEIIWLRDFLTEGAALGHPGVAESCKKNLTQLDKLKSSHEL